MALDSKYAGSMLSIENSNCPMLAIALALLFVFHK